MDLGKFAKHAGLADLAWAGGLAAAYSINKFRSPRSGDDDASSPPDRAPRDVSGGTRLNFSERRPSARNRVPGPSKRAPPPAAEEATTAAAPETAAAGPAEDAVPPPAPPVPMEVELEEGMLVCLLLPDESTPLAATPAGKGFVLVHSPPLPTADSKEGVVRVPAVSPDSLFYVTRRMDGRGGSSFCFRSVSCGQLLGALTGDAHPHRLVGGQPGPRESWAVAPEGGVMACVGCRGKPLGLRVQEVRSSMVQMHRQAEMSALRDARELRGQARAADTRALEADRRLRNVGESSHSEIQTLKRELMSISGQVGTAGAELRRMGDELRESQREGARLAGELRIAKQDAERARREAASHAEATARSEASACELGRRHAEQLRAARAEAEAARSESRADAERFDAERRRLSHALEGIAHQAVTASPAVAAPSSKPIGSRGHHGAPPSSAPAKAGGASSSWRAVHFAAPAGSDGDDDAASTISSHALSIGDLRDMDDDIVTVESVTYRGGGGGGRRKGPAEAGAGGAGGGAEEAGGGSPPAAAPVAAAMAAVAAAAAKAAGAEAAATVRGPAARTRAPGAAAPGGPGEDGVRKKLEMGAAPATPPPPPSAQYLEPVRTSAGGKRLSAAPPSFLPAGGGLGSTSGRADSSAKGKGAAASSSSAAASSSSAGAYAAGAGQGEGQGKRAAGGKTGATPGAKAARPLNRLCNMEDLFGY